MNMAVGYRVLLAHLVVLRCALTTCNAHEFVDDTWIPTSASGQEKTAVSTNLVEAGYNEDFPGASLGGSGFYKTPKSLIPGNEHHQSRSHYGPASGNSIRVEEPAKQDVSFNDKEAVTFRRRFLSGARNARMNPSFLGLSEKADDNYIPRQLLEKETKKRHFTSRTQSQPPTCARLEEYLCRGMNHPLCVVRYPPPVSTLARSTCRVNVRCNYTSNFFSSQGFCFAVRNAFPAPLLLGVNQSTLSYNHTVKLYVNLTVVGSYSAVNGAGDAIRFLRGNMSSSANNTGLTSVNIATDYVCAHMTPCSFTT